MYEKGIGSDVQATPAEVSNIKDAGMNYAKMYCKF